MDGVLVGTYLHLTCGSADTTILPASSHRAWVGISNPTANGLFVAWGQPVSINQHWSIPSGTRPQWFSRDRIGGLIDTELHGVYATAGGQVAIIVSYYR